MISPEELALLRGHERGALLLQADRHLVLAGLSGLSNLGVKHLEGVRLAIATRTNSRLSIRRRGLRRLRCGRGGPLETSRKPLGARLNLLRSARTKQLEVILRKPVLHGSLHAGKLGSRVGSQPLRSSLRIHELLLFGL